MPEKPNSGGQTSSQEKPPVTEREKKTRQEERERKWQEWLKKYQKQHGPQL